MEPNAGTTETRSNGTASDMDEVAALESLQFTDEIHRLISAPTTDNASSFTALLELPAPQAVELLHSPESAKLIAAPAPALAAAVEDFKGSFHFPSNSGLIERAARFSVFGGEGNNNNTKKSNSPETTSNNSSANLEKAVKSEPAETESSQPLFSDPTVEKRSIKRKDREKKAKGSTKKSKTKANESSEDAEKLPYVHVRARRGQATDSHSLAERARREKINARMKLLQELVPGCNKISGTALVLDEIINHVQSLQRQVEFLSMRLAAVNPRIDFNLDSIFTAESGSLMDSNFPSMVMPLMWPEVQVNGNRQTYQQQWHFDALQQPVLGREEVCNNYITPENSLLSYDSSTNSGVSMSSIYPSQLETFKDFSVRRTGDKKSGLTPSQPTLDLYCETVKLESANVVVKFCCDYDYETSKIVPTGPAPILANTFQLKQEIGTLELLLGSKWSMDNQQSTEFRLSGVSMSSIYPSQLETFKDFSVRRTGDKKSGLTPSQPTLDLYCETVKLESANVVVKFCCDYDYETSKIVPTGPAPILANTAELEFGDIRKEGNGVRGWHLRHTQLQKRLLS
ncbi:hypothetical protein REPUB_Repub02eG0186700 [Reevesia pubescens]